MHTRRENDAHRPLWTEVKIIDKERYWRIEKLDESVLKLSTDNILSKSSIELNIIWGFMEKITEYTEFFNQLMIVCVYIS